MSHDSAPRRYSFPRSFVVRWVTSALLGRRRELWRDGRELLRTASPTVEGQERLPEGTRYIVVMNHYERPGLDVWWAALAVNSALGAPDLRWIITNRFYRYRLFGRIPVPVRLVGSVLRFVARTYDYISIERRPEGVAERAVALRRMRRSLDAEHPRPLGSTPEAEFGGGVALRDPYPSSGKALAWLSRGQIPIVPIGVRDDRERIVFRVGEPFVLEWPGAREARGQRDALAARVMREIAAVLPPEQRGGWEPQPQDCSNRGAQP